MKTHEKFLQFNGKTIYFQSYDGQFWIAIKPICEILNVNYNRSFGTWLLFSDRLKLEY